MSEKLYFSKIPKVECWDLEPYYFVFREGVPNAAEAYALEFKNNQALIKQLEEERNLYKITLELVAMGKRADGTYNRCREACEQLAKEALIEGEKIRGGE